MYVPTTAELTGDEDEFFERYFNRAPLLRRDALRGDPREVLSVADLDEVLGSEAIRPPYLDIAKDGKQVPRAAYTEPIVVQGEVIGAVAAGGAKIEQDVLVAKAALAALKLPG